MNDILDIENGILCIDKPAGMTSFGVVARVRRVLSKRAGKKVKVGHTGTLDPFATGLMILVIGKECKNAEKYTKHDKVYEATFILGEKSSTGDPEGEITKISDKTPEINEVEQAIKEFTGKIQQRPPIFSAIKIDGKRAYKLARDGQEIEMPLRDVEIFSFEICEYKYPELKVKVHVSSGTYIRSLAVDLGEKLQTGAYCSELRRLKVAECDVSDAKKLEDFGVNS